MEGFRKRIEEIAGNITAGSVEVLNETIRALEDLSAEKEDYSKQELLNVLKALAGKRPEFLALSHFVNELAVAAEKNSPLSVWLKKYREKWDGVNRRVAEQAVKQIDLASKAVLLHSNSSAIKALFELLAERHIPVHLLQTISRPEEEGRLQGAFLEKLGFPVELLDEDEPDALVGRIDVALFGADAIYSDAFLNKTATRLIAVNCKEKEKPLYVLADSRKRLDVQSSQLKAGAFGQYFELTENELVTNFVFE